METLNFPFSSYHGIDGLKRGKTGRPSPGCVQELVFSYCTIVSKPYCSLCREGERERERTKKERESERERDQEDRETERVGEREGARVTTVMRPARSLWD